jgi:hypothetical protein
VDGCRLPHRPTKSVTATQPQETEPEDPRQRPALLLLDELADRDDVEVVQASVRLRTALHDGFDQLRQAQDAAAAHALLGSTNPDGLTAHAEERLGQLVQTLTALHRAAQDLNATRQTPMDSVRALVHKLAAEVEVSQELNAARRSQQARSQRR